MTYTATAAGGSGIGYGYSWSGSASGTGTGSQIAFTPSHAGVWPESVTVTDSTGQTGSGNCDANVENSGGGSSPPITATPTSQTIGPTSTASHLITINSAAGISGPITFMASGLPVGATASFSPSVSSSGSTTLSVTAAPGSPTGTFPIAVTALGSSQSATAYVVLNVAQPFPASLITPPPSSLVSNGSITFNWDAGEGVTAYQLLVGSTPGGSNIYSGSQTTAQSATFTVSTTAPIIYATLSSLCGGVWTPQPPYPFPVRTPPATGTQVYAGSVPGSNYQVPNNGSSATLPLCLALSAGGQCDNTVLPAVALGLYSCNVTTNGQYPGIPAPGVTVTSLSPYDPNNPSGFDVTLTAASTPPATYYMQCFFNNASPISALWSFQVDDATPVVSYFQESPTNPDGSFYVTLWGHNFGPDQGAIQVCIQGGCSDGSMNVCLSAACGNAYYTWSDQQINALIQPSGAPDGTYQGTLCSYGESGTSSCLYVSWLFPFPASTSPTAAIYQNGVNITGQTQTVLVGQQIALNGYSNLASTVNQGWWISNATYVGGYRVTTSGYNPSEGCLVDANAPDPNACVPQGTPVNASGQNFTIYFTPPTTGQVTVYYTVFGTGGVTEVASAYTTFTVVGPGGEPFAGIAAGLGPNGVTVDNNTNLGAGVVAIHYGSSAQGSTSPGIGFGFNAQGYPTLPNSYPPASPPTITTPPGYPYGFPGTLQWLQIVTDQSATPYNPSLNSYPPVVTCVAGVDVTKTQPNYPYYLTVPNYSNQTNDSPNFALTDNNGQSVMGTGFVGAGGSYNMYLMFQPSTPNSIPVPVAVIPWSWSGGATYDAGGSWVLTVATGDALPNGSTGAITNGVFPVWKSSCAFQNPSSN